MTNLSLAISKTGIYFYILYLTIGLVLAIGLVYILVPMADDATDMGKISYRFCNNETLDPSDLNKLRDFLFQTENVTFENDLEMQDYLCGNCRDCFFQKGDKEFTKLFKMTKQYFHRKIKDEYLGYFMRIPRIKKYLKKIDTDNPNFGVNKKTGRITLQNPKNPHEMIETNVPLSDILP